MGFDAFTIPAFVRTVNYPRDRVTQSFLQHRQAGLSDGRQTFQCPCTRTALPQLAHEDAVRQEDHVHVAGLAKAIPELTIAHAQMLLAVPMKALRPAPTTPIDPQNPCDLPESPIGDQYLTSLDILPGGPENDDPNRMIHVRDSDAFREIPLPVLADGQKFPVLGGDLFCQNLGLENLSLKDDLTIEFQIADIGPFLGVDMIEIRRVGEIAVEGEIAGDRVMHDPIDQFAEQDVVIAKVLGLLDTPLPLDESTKLQRVVLAGSADVIDDQVVVGDLVTLLGVIPEPTDILDELAVVIDEGIVNGDDSLRAVRRGRVFLQPSEPSLIELLGVPEPVSRNPAVQARLIGGDGELTVDAGNVLLVGHQQTGKILGEMFPFRFVLKETPELVQGFFDDRGKVHNSWHRRILHQDFRHPASNIHRPKARFDLNISTLQNVS